MEYLSRWNKLFILLLLIIFLAEFMMMIIGKLSMSNGNWLVLVLLITAFLLPTRQSIIILLIISFYGIFSMLYYGAKSAVPTAMEFTSGISLNMPKSIVGFIIGVFPFYFYLVQIGYSIFFFTRKNRRNILK